MGCTTSRLDRLPAVSLCHHRCKFLDESLRYSYSLFDAHLAYMHSLKSLGPTLRRFLDQNVAAQSDSLSQNTHATTTTAVIEPNASKSSSSSDSDSSTHIDLQSDSEDEEEFIRDGNFDLLHNINPNCFRYQTLTPNQLDYSYYDRSNGESFAAAWKTPSPPAPSSSAWDFLNFFESYERYDLLKMDKGAINDTKTDKTRENCEKIAGEKDNQSAVKSVTKDGNVKKKKEEADPVKSTDAVYVKMQGKEENESKNRSVNESLGKVEVMFERASESGIEVLKLLDTGKFHQHYHSGAGCSVGESSKLLQADAPYAEKMGSVNPDFNGDLSTSSCNLFSTTKKLCVWEKKLYDEVKAEEKLRIVLARYCGQMKSFAEKGGKTSKVDSTRALLRTISTKINVSIQVIDKISVSISKLRDEELWPQIIELIQKLFEMWKAMAECHQCQSQAVVEARNLDAITSTIKYNDAYLESAFQLKIELQKWNLSFCNWIDSQRGYLKALNNWLLKCLPQEPEGIPDGLSHLSPGRMGTPPLFALCNQWSHAMNSISEMEVMENINGLFMNLNQMLEREHMTLQQRVIADKDAEKKIKILEREEQKMQRLLLARGKKVFLSNKNAGGSFLPAGALHGSERTATTSLHLCLKQIFTAVDRFSAENMKAYEELSVYIEEARSIKVNAEGP